MDMLEVLVKFHVSTNRIGSRSDHQQLSITQVGHRACGLRRSHKIHSMAHSDSAAVLATRPKHAALPLHQIQQLNESSSRTSSATFAKLSHRLSTSATATIPVSDTSR